jgi:hypothetical protein
MDAHLTEAEAIWREEPLSVPAPCPNCFESSGYMARVHAATWTDPAWADSDPMNPCPVCEGTGSVDSEPATLEDLEELADLEAEAKP